MTKIKKIFVLLLAGAISCGVVACGENTPESKPEEKEYSNEVQVVLLLGQSNAEGHTYVQYLEKTVGAAKANLYANGFDKVKISFANTISNNTSNGEFVSVKTGQGYTVERFGPEVGMAEKISEFDPVKRVYIIKYTYGGTTLNTQWRSPSSGNTGYLYTNAVNYTLQQCRKLEDADLYPVIKAICWMQGESDASGPSYNSYKTLEKNLVNDLRSDLAYYKDPNSEIGFVDAGISDCVAWTQYAIINSAKMQLADEDEYHTYLDTIAANLKYNAEPAGAPDIYHYDSASQIKLGHLFGEALLSKYLEIE